jgi:hypothetical protein
MRRATDPALAAVARLTPEVTRTSRDGLRGVRVVPADAAGGACRQTRDATALGRDANVRFVVETDLASFGNASSFVTARLSTRSMASTGEFASHDDRRRSACGHDGDGPST